MTASLPMYDTAATAAANDLMWRLVRNALGEGPFRLVRNRTPWEIWRHPDLVLSQTCSLPYRMALSDQVTLVGTPDYGVSGCPPGYYRSVIVARRNDRRSKLSCFAGARLARNGPDSQSGWAAVEAHLVETNAGFSFQGNCLDTGSHAASARAVLERQADLAALDAVTWGLLQREMPQSRGLHVIEKTAPTPGLPLITAKSRDPETIFRAVATAIDQLPTRARDRLMLRGLAKIPKASYLALPLPAQDAPQTA